MTAATNIIKGSLIFFTLNKTTIVIRAITAEYVVQKCLSFDQAANPAFG